MAADSHQGRTPQNSLHLVYVTSKNIHVYCMGCSSGSYINNFIFLRGGRLKLSLEEQNMHHFTSIFYITLQLCSCAECVKRIIFMFKFSVVIQTHSLPLRSEFLSTYISLHVHVLILLLSLCCP